MFLLCVCVGRMMLEISCPFFFILAVILQLIVMHRNVPDSKENRLEKKRNEKKIRLKHFVYIVFIIGPCEQTTLTPTHSNKFRASIT